LARRIGGFITTYLTWHWIFLINIPIGLLGIFMALRYIDPIRSEDPERFDLYGLVLAGIGLGGIAFGLSIAGLNLVPWTVVIALIAIGTIKGTVDPAVGKASEALQGRKVEQTDRPSRERGPKARTVPRKGSKGKGK